MKGKLTLIKASGFNIFVRTFGILQLSQVVTPIRSLDVCFFSPNLHSKKLATVIKMNLPRKGKLAIKCFFFISDVFFDPKFDRCFCTECHASRGDQLYYTRGRPPKDYGIPIGWCRFGLKLVADVYSYFN